MRLRLGPALALSATWALACQTNDEPVAADAGWPEPSQVNWLSYDLETRTPGDAGLPEETVDRQTIAVDWERGLVLSGRTGTMRLERLTRAGDQLATDPFATSVLCPDFRTGTELQYASFAVQRAGDGLEGRAQLRLLSSGDGYAATKLMSARLVGMPDASAPILAFWGNGHPMDGIRLTASEVLRAPVALDVGAPGLPRITMASQAGDYGFVGASQLDVALGFGVTYTVRPLGDLVDLAGHPIAFLPTYTTLADPGFFAQDGFEGPLRAYIQAATQTEWDGTRLTMLEIVDGGEVPAPAGARALLLRPWLRPAPSGTACGGQRFTARLRVPAGATQVSASMALVLANLHGSSLSLALAAPGHEVVKSSLLDLPVDRLVNCSEESLYLCSDVVTWSAPLPPGTSDEVMFDLRGDCQSQGLLLDDLRVE